MSEYLRYIVNRTSAIEKECREIRECASQLAVENSNSVQQPHAKICQDIVEDQLNYLIRIGLCFKDGEKDSVRDSLHQIVVGKLSA